MTLVLATKNEDKKKELLSLLADTQWDIVTLNDFPDMPDVIEDADTFEGNAIKKAKETSLHTGLIALGDDSGLMVDALNGAPGVYSARYSGEDATYQSNRDLLLKNMEGIVFEERQAQFLCYMALVKGKEVLSLVNGVCEGLIAEKYQGSKGFGYDPLFYVPSEHKTFAAMRSQDKNAISHRGKALQQIKVFINKRF